MAGFRGRAIASSNGCREKVEEGDRIFQRFDTLRPSALLVDW
ncbi:MAG: hypothetical protein ABWU13_13635 [Limnospira maxima]